MNGNHNGVVLCLLSEENQNERRQSNIKAKREVSEGAGNVMPDHNSDLRVKLNDGCFCGRQAPGGPYGMNAYMNALMYV